MKIGIGRLTPEFLARAHENERLSNPAAAAAFRKAAELVEAAVASHDSELLTISAACGESGYTYHGIYGLVRKGVIENFGGKGRPLVRRGDIPLKPNMGRLDPGRISKAS